MVSKIIRMIDGEYSHIAIALSENVILEAQRFTESRIIKYTPVNYDILKLTLTEEQEAKLVDTSLELIGYEYDYAQIFSTFLHLVFRFKLKNSRKKYICSELIVELLYLIDYLSDSEYNLLIDSTPNELYAFLREKEISLLD